ncbi:MAG: sigma-70 family RNA polymerase sigma factor [Haloferula sp.]|uniref:sigma-70 family RNA polymerase sigma factor n=1 Tax=Haloferula sp. TaxID=2497595 RepID=UPI0032A00D22
MSEITELQSALRQFIGYLMSGASGVSDLVQEVNVLLWQKRDQFEIGTNFRAWAFTIARYRVLGHLRQKRKEGQFLFSTELIDRLADEWQEDPDEHETQLVALEFCMEKLPSDDLDLVRARYNEHGGVERFAKELGLSAGSLRLRLFRLRAGLKRCVEKQIEGEGGFA